MTPVPNRKQSFCARRVANVDQAAAKAYRDAFCAIDPTGLASFSPQLAASARQAMNYVTAVNPAPPAASVVPPGVQGDFGSSPVSQPLNNLPWPNACKGKRQVSAALSTEPAAVAVPVSGPSPVQVQPIRASAPTWGNLCWALRNGAVDASQFDPADLAKLQLRCAQLGYTGACPPPPAVAAYLAAGKLPKIPVSDSDIALLPRAPNVTGITCDASWKLGGLTGVEWGDAGGTCGRARTGGAGLDLTTAPWLAIALVGVVALGVISVLE
jgi:hypothetical protein